MKHHARKKDVCSRGGRKAHTLGLHTHWLTCNCDVLFCGGAAMAGSTCDLSLFSRTGCRAYILSVQKQIQPLKCEQECHTYMTWASTVACYFHRRAQTQAPQQDDSRKYKLSCTRPTTVHATPTIKKHPSGLCGSRTPPQSP